MSDSAGSWLVMLIVWTPLPGMLKLTVSGPGLRPASVSAARSVQTPAPDAQTPLPGAASASSAVEFTTKVIATFAWARPLRAVGRTAAATAATLVTEVQPLEAAAQRPVSRAASHARADNIRSP